MTGILNLLAGVSSAIKDTYFNLTTLLLPGDGTNGAQNNTFLDSSTNNFTITRNGNTTQGTFSPFSQTGWSNSFASGAVLNLNGGTPLTFGTGDFTIEFWVYYNGGLTADVALYDSRPTSTNGVYPLLYSNPTGKMVYYINSAARITSTTTLVVGTWYHVALARSGTSTKLFINGTQEGSTYTDSNDYLLGTNRPTIGAAGISLGADPLNGYMSNVRVVKGTAVYTSNFTPPTSPLTAITNTSLLTCQSNRFIDNSTNAFAITVTSSPSVQAFSPFAPTAAYSAATVGGSGYFDGTGDYLSVADNANLRLGTSAFTIQAWIYRAASGTAHSIIAKGGASTGFVFQVTSGNVLRFTHGTTNVDTTTTIPASSWTHVAAVRTGTGTNEFQLYINGVSSVTATVATDFNQTDTLYVGADRSAATTMNGYISGLKYTNGTAESISVPTSPPTATTNVALLTNYTNAGITDATAKNDLETVGNAQISTTQSKFGGSSMYFDGTGDWCLVRNDQNFNMGSGDFTIEFWAYTTSRSSSGTCWVSKWGSTATSGRSWIPVFTTSTGKLEFYISTDGSNATAVVSETYTPSLNDWNHYAITRSGSTFRFFVNGSLIGSGTNSGTLFSADEPLCVGANYEDVQGGVSSYNTIGYIDDLRITKGYARYTAAFTAPTAAFPLQ